jgi:5-methylcytosine-specific restriction endonuclease McrA
MTTIEPLTQLSDQQLTARVIALAEGERSATVALVASLAEFDARRLFLAAGCSSLFTYCTQVLHLSEHAAYGRIEAARAARRFPVLLDLLAEGALTLTTVCLLAPHLTEANHAEVLASARHKTKREVELLVATLRPLPPVPTTIRRLPTHKPVTTTDVGLGSGHEEPAASPSPREQSQRGAVVAPLSPQHYKLQVTLSAETYATLRRAQDLMRHTAPIGDVAVIVDRALKLLVRELEQQKVGATNRPRTADGAAQSQSRHIPANVRRTVWERDEGRCAFMGTQGRCNERGFLEFHHVQPYADGGQNTVDNLELRCRAHNAYEAARWDGTLFARELPEVYSVLDRVRYVERLSAVQY